MWIILGLLTQFIGIHIDFWVPTIMAWEECVVTQVQDGDTIQVNCNNTTERVRLIGIDAPEKSEYWYQKSTLFLQKMIEGEIIRLEKDIHKQDTDKFWRKLRYVYKDTVNINKTMLALWRAKEFAYDSTYKDHKTFKITQYFSIQNKKWIRSHYTKPFASNCYIGKETIQHWKEKIFYKEKEVLNIQYCKEQIRSCNNGILSGEYEQNTCRVR